MVAKVIAMWDLMLSPATEEQINSAVKRFNIAKHADLLRRADVRFASLNTKPSGDAALDKMVVAAGFAHYGERLLHWLEEVSGLQQEYNDDREEPDEEPYDMDALFAEAEKGVLRLRPGRRGAGAGGRHR